MSKDDCTISALAVFSGVIALGALLSGHLFFMVLLLVLPGILAGQKGRITHHLVFACGAFGVGAMLCGAFYYHSAELFVSGLAAVGFAFGVLVLFS